MKILFTLDYELFLGIRSGSPERCLIEPMQRLMDETSGYGVKFTLFVDATYLLRLKELGDTHIKLKNEFKCISNHLRKMSELGHDVQLHIHPHWVYSTFDGEKWDLDHDHYKLCDLPYKEAERIFSASKALLDSIIGKATIAFRAGGFSTQPTSMLSALFLKNGIGIDSSVCPGTVYDSDQQRYDYLNCPKKQKWRFEDDICKDEAGGRFVEIPITMRRVSPLFNWRYMATRILKQSKHKTLGDGVAVKATRDSIVQRLTSFSPAMATIDGFKILNLKSCYKECERCGGEYLNIIGHPKLATPYSVKKMNAFCRMAKRNGDMFVTISDCL